MKKNGLIAAGYLLLALFVHFTVTLLYRNNVLPYQTIRTISLILNGMVVVYLLIFFAPKVTQYKGLVGFISIIVLRFTFSLSSQLISAYVSIDIFRFLLAITMILALIVFLVLMIFVWKSPWFIILVTIVEVAMVLYNSILVHFIVRRLYSTGINLAIFNNFNSLMSIGSLCLMALVIYLVYKEEPQRNYHQLKSNDYQYDSSML